MVDVSLSSYSDATINFVSHDEKIGLGVGLGIGIPVILLLGILIYFLHRVSRRVPVKARQGNTHQSLDFVGGGSVLSSGPTASTPRELNNSETRLEMPSDQDRCELPLNL